MKFREFPIDECEKAILAHSVRLQGGGFIKKGKSLTSEDIEAFRSDGINVLLVAKLEADDVGEDEAARRIAEKLVSPGIEMRIAGTGRVNLHAVKNGLFHANAELVNKLNEIDPGITLATLADKAPVLAGRMLATVKIIPYAVKAENLIHCEAVAKGELIALFPYRSMKVAVISTTLPTLKKSTIDKTVNVLRQRLAPSGSEIVAELQVEHVQNALMKAISEVEAKADMVIIFGASAISDENDIIPCALAAAGGEITRFGMPVDPGNLLLLGKLNGKPVLGAPGCARSPAENGFDFVLNRLFAGVDVSFDDIGKMGVGGLLMEIGSRPSPREKSGSSKLRASAVILAAGRSTRMGRENKLLALLDGKPLVAHVANAAGKSRLVETIIVTGHEAESIKNALGQPGSKFVHNPDYGEGLATSLLTGIGSIDDNSTHALILLGDMPAITSVMIDKLIDAARNAPAGSIIMATSNGKRGNPILWPRAYFETLMSVTGDTGAKHLLFENSEKIVEVELGEAASLDVDTESTLREIGGELPAKNDATSI